MDGESNGHPATYKFGDAPGNMIPESWVEPLLRALHDQSPQAFGQRLAEVAARQLAGIDVRAGKARVRV